VEYITTFSFQSPSEKTQLAPSGAPVVVLEPSANAELDAFFRPPPQYSHEGGGLRPLNAGGPRPLDDEFQHFLDRAKKT
jgi:hypothetical protein